MRFSRRCGRSRIPAVSGDASFRSPVPSPRAPALPDDHAAGPPAAGFRDEHPSGPLPAPVDARLVDDEPATVEVAASPGTARRLAAVAPESWRVVATPAPSHHPCVDFVVLVEPSADLVVDVVARQPYAEAVVLLGRSAPAGRVVEMLDAGASVCLRDSPARLVAGHIIARRRRGRRRPS